jgi:hypothetical protein
MFASRVLGTIGLLLAAVPAGWGQTCSLQEPIQAGDCFHIQIDMKLSGEMRIRKDDKTVPLKLEATANHEYPERLLALGPNGIPQKSARVYETAKAVIKVADDRSERALRPERRLFVSQRYKDQGLVYCPAGALTRSELDLTAGQFDTLTVSGVLPAKEVKAGETWKVPSSVVQALCNFEGLTEQNVVGKLDTVTDDAATFTLSGTATGIDLGALAKLKIEATGHFDRKSKRLVALEWTQKDERDQGPVSPATVVEMTVALKRQPIDQPAGLSDVALVSVPSDETPPTPLLQLDHRDAQGRFALMYPREWQIVAETKDHLVMRLMDRGDFVAQVTVTPWKSAGKGQHISPEDFKQAMHDTAGWEPEKELQAGEVPVEKGRWVYRLSASGQMDGVAVVQNFYLVAGPDGQQIVVAFTMTPKQVEKLGARDLAFVGSMEVPAGK